MNLNNVSTKTFSYINYNDNNIEHKIFFEDITNDELTLKFFNNWKTLFSTADNQNINAFIVEKDNIPVGLVTLIQQNDNNYVFSHVISPKHRGNRYSSILKNELLEYIFKNNLANNIICYIDKDNKNSISSMLRTNPDNIISEKGNEKLLKVIYSNKNNLKGDVENEKSR